MDLEPRFDWTRASPIINNMVLFFNNDCVDTHLVIRQRFFPGCWRILALNGSQLQMPWNFTTVCSAVSRSTEIKPFEDGLVHMCRYHLYLNRNFFGFNMPSRSCRACINVADSVSEGKIMGSLRRRRFWATDDNRKWAVFLSQYIVKYLFSGRDD